MRLQRKEKQVYKLYRYFGDDKIYCTDVVHGIYVRECPNVLSDYLKVFSYVILRN